MRRKTKQEKQNPFPEREKPQKKRGGRKRNYVLEERCVKCPLKTDKSHFISWLYNPKWHSIGRYADLRAAKNARVNAGKRAWYDRGKYEHRIICPNGEIV